MKRIFITYGHHNTKNSFNSAIRDTFIEEAEKLGHKIDLLNLFDEKEQLPYYNSNFNPPPKLVLDYRKRLENCDVMMLIGSCHNLRLNAILENWVDWVLHPKWFFSYRSLVPGNKYFKNYGYPVPGAMKGKLGIVSITYGGPMITYQNFSFQKALKTALGMSFISMISMEVAMNITDYVLTGGAMLTWWVVPIMLAVGFVTPWPYNYWRLKKHNQACH